MKKGLNIIKNILNILLIIVLFILASTIIISKLETGINLDIYSVQSGSMQPSIKAGSLVIVQKNDKYNTGDIITYTTQNEMTVTHRIVRIEEEKYITKGDANNTEDAQPIEETQIIGKVNYTLPLLGYPFSFAKTPTGFILLIILPATLIIAGEVVNISKELTKIKKKKNDENTD